MRYLAMLVALLAITAPASAQTLCSSPTMDACFSLTSFDFQEYAAINSWNEVVPNVSDYQISLRGTWSGSAFDGLTDLWWTATFGDFSTMNGSYYRQLTPGVETASQQIGRAAQGLAQPSLDLAQIRVLRGAWPVGPTETRTWPSEVVVSCGYGNCYQPEPEVEPLAFAALASSEAPTDEPVSVPEPATLGLLLPGLAMLAHRSRSLISR